MWQRFTERARRVVFFAQEEAGRLGENYVSTEHLLLGLVRENDSVAAKILDQMGISLGRIRSEIERQVTHGDGRIGQDMQLTPRAKRVIDLGYDEARRLSNNFIGTEHLLLGLIREGEGLAGRLLSKLGADLESTRKVVMIVQNKVAATKTRDATVDILDAIKESQVTGASVGNKIYKAIHKIHEKNKAREIETESYRTTAIIDTLTGLGSLWRGESLVSLKNVSGEQINQVLDAAELLKSLHRENEEVVLWGYSKTLAMIFEKPSLRTRVSFEAGMAQLGGHAIYLAPGDIGLGTREPVADVAAALSRWVSVISARVFKHETVEELAANATVPVINALSDREHPIQAFADLLTIREQKGALGNNLKLAYIGDGNNVLHALLLACAKTGVNISAACPAGYEPSADYVEEARRISSEENTGSEINIITDPVEAVQNADVVYTDVWTSMGQETEKADRAAIFAPYQINSELMTHAKPDAIVLHCLPAHQGEEISAEIFEKHKTVIMDQAENRMHTQKALIVLMLGV